MSSVKMEEIDRFLLSPEQSAHIFENKIKPKLFHNVFSNERPMLVLFGGQPGAGKNAAIAVAKEELAQQGDSVSILGDELRAYHPEYYLLLEANDKTAAFYTGKDAGRWIEQSIAHAKEMRCNVVIEGTMRSPEMVAQTIKTFRDAGYFIDARALAVPERLSWQNVLQRYENGRGASGFGRMSLEGAHREAYEGLPRSLDKIEREKLADHLSIYARDNTLLYENRLENGQWKNPTRASEVVEQERNRPWTLSERFHYARRFDRLTAWIKNPERRATPEEINSMEALRKSAHADISITEKQALIVKEAAKAIVMENVKDKGVAANVIASIEQQLEKRLQDGTLLKGMNTDKAATVSKDKEVMVGKALNEVERSR